MKHPHLGFTILFSGLLFVLTACGGEPTPTPDAVATQIAVEEIAHATMTAQAPTPSPVPTRTHTPANAAVATPEPVDYDFEIIFDGQQCFVTLYDLTAGRKQYLFTNTSGKDAFPYICKLDPDKSWQDLVDYSGAPGAWRPEAKWCRSQGGSKTGEDGDSEIWSATLFEGEHMILCDQAEDPEGGWLGAGFWIH
jgi:hypothetical protein